MPPATWRRLAVSLALTTMLCATGWLSLAAAAAVAPRQPIEAPALEAAVTPGRLVMAVPPHLDRPMLDALASRYGARVERWAPRLGLALLSVPVGRELQAASVLEAEPLVRFVAEHRFLARAADMPSDEYWDSQWGMAQVDAPGAWDAAWADPAVTIAVIDTGVHLQHWDLAGQIWLNPGESMADPLSGQLTCDAPLASNMADDDDNGYVDDCTGYDFVQDDNTPMDEHLYGHGTFVAGIAGAATNNLDSALSKSEGVAGMARQARLMALRALDAAGRGSAFDIAQAIDYATANGAQIINLSLTFPPTTPPGSSDIEILRLAVEAAQAADVLLVAASGNDNYNGVSFPGRFPGVLAVGASRRDDSRASFSNYGERLDLVAPGVEIFSTLLHTGIHSYGYYRSSMSNSSGTSFAAPHVAGVAALVRSLRPDLRQEDVYDLVRRTADDVGDPGFDNPTGWGRLNAQRAVSEALSGLQLELAADPPTLAVDGVGTVRLSITAPGGEPAGFGARVTLHSAPGSGGGVAGACPPDCQPASIPTTVTVDSRGQAAALFAAGAFTGAAHITATLGNLTATLPVTITSGLPATLTLAAQPAVVAINGQAVITATVRDEGGNAVLDGTPVAFSATLGAIAPVTATTVAGQAAATFTAGALAGAAVIEAEAGGYTATLPIAILGAGEPYTVTLAAAPPQIRVEGEPAVITATVTDPLGAAAPDGITVTFTTDLGQLLEAEVLTVGGLGVTQLGPGLAPGVAQVTARAGYATGRLEVPILERAYVTLTLVADPAELTADFNQVAHLTASAVDQDGVPAPDGTMLEFTTSLGQVIPSSAPTAGGTAKVLLLGGRVAGVATVTVTEAGGAQASTQVRIRPGQPAALELEIAPEQIVVGEEAALVPATVRDSFGNLAADGTLVQLTTDLGFLRAISGTQVITGTWLSIGTVNGVAEAALAPGQTAGLAEVRAALGTGVTQTRYLRIAPGPAAQVTVTANPDRVRVGGRVELSARVSDRYGNAVADGARVNFLATRGRLDEASAPTQEGVAVTWLTAPDKTGSVEIIALSAAVSGSTIVAVLSPTFLPVIER